MKIYLGADHGGFSLKEKVKEWLTEWGYEFEDMGNTVVDDEDDYPVFAFKVADKVAKNPGSFGVLACRSAAGMVIAANKFKRVRAVSAFDRESAMHSKQHNDANVLALSGDWLTEEKAKEIVKTFLDTPFSDEERHIRRVNLIKKQEDFLYD